MESGYEITLEYPALRHKEAVLGYLQEHIGQGEYSLHGACGLDHALSYEGWLEGINRCAQAGGDIRSTTFFGVRKCDGKIIGTIDIRHEQDECLERYSGHVAYGVRPMERKKGYATQMLHLALDYCVQLGIDDVLLSCASCNIAGAKTILKCGGVFESEATSAPEILQRYRIRPLKILEGEIISV